MSCYRTPPGAPTDDLRIFVRSNGWEARFPRGDNEFSGHPHRLRFRLKVLYHGLDNFRNKAAQLFREALQDLIHDLVELLGIRGGPSL